MGYLHFRTLRPMPNKWKHIWGAINSWHLPTVTMTTKILENDQEYSVWSLVKVGTVSKWGVLKWNLKKRNMNFKIKRKPGKMNWIESLLKISSKQTKFAINQSRVRRQILVYQERFVNIVTNTPILWTILSKGSFILDIKVTLVSTEVGARVSECQVLEVVTKK